ncbi:DUF3010 family protein [Kiloniella sp. EL199]|uniref:DUF3010 family protein n=1 Tax=Kiloniella sp. EL199 TaxID=2107581 RepID=UPI000EA049A9|nr:DUF3010 family protein [Kiloniella sp. EL199]
MRVCGIELKSNEAILVVLEAAEDGPVYIALPTRKITLGDSDKAADVTDFQRKITAFFKENDVTKVAIKKRAKKGKFAGGPDTFKMEALIQVIPDLEVQLVTPQALAAMEKKQDIIYPNSLMKYQEVAYLAGVWLFK